MSLICSYLQYLVPNFGLITLEKMFLSNQSPYGNLLNLLTPRLIFLMRDLARVTKSCEVLYYAAVPIKLYILTYSL